MKKLLVISLLCLGLAAPSFSSEKQDDGKSQERIVQEMKAMAERDAQTKCPMSGAPIAEGKGVEYMGHFIGTCCDNCAAKVEKSPLTALLKVRQNGEEPKLAEGFTRMDRCPMSGKPVKEDIFAVENNVLMKFCCPACPQGFAEKPEELTSKLMEQKIAPYLITLEQTTCPVSGHPVNESMVATVEGKKVGLCCAACKSAIEQEPAKYLEAMADNGIVVADAD